MIVEIKVREFRAKLLLATKLAQRGMRVYLGSRDAVMHAIVSREQPGGVYYFKGGEPPDVFADVRHHCAYVVGQDEEIGPALSPTDVERAWDSRYSARVVDMIDHVYVFSSAHLNILEHVRPALAAKAEVTGWPRADLWQAKLWRPDVERAQQIRTKYGDFILFASSFKINSEEQREHAIQFARASHARNGGADRQDQSPDDDYGSRATHRLESFRRAADFLREFATESEATIIVRPHPSESPQAWADAVADTPIQVCAGGAAGPWLMAARAMLHAGCTTAVEAANYGVACGYLDFIGYQGEAFTSTASCHASHSLGDIAAVRGFVDSVLDGSLDAAPNNLPIEMFGPQDGRASDRIADAVAGLDLAAEAPLTPRARVPTQRTAARVVAAWRDSRWSRSRFTGTNAQRKLPGGIHRPEAQAILTEFGGATELSVTEPRFDLLQIESH